MQAPVPLQRVREGKQAPVPLQHVCEGMQAPAPLQRVREVMRAPVPLQREACKHLCPCSVCVKAPVVGSHSCTVLALDAAAMRQ